MNAVVERKPPKAKTCKKSKGGCGAKFTPLRSMQSACGISCAQAMAQHKREKESARREQEERRQTKARREKMKTLPQLLKEAQREFNRFIRLRDAGRVCISTSRPLASDVVGGGYDAGHYRSVGSAGHLRFNEDNCHAQSKYANQYLAGDVQAYRIGLIARIGIERVEALEANNTPHKWDKDEVREIRDRYRAKANQLERELNAEI